MRRRSLLAGALAAPALAACSGGGTGAARTSARGRTTLSYGIWDKAQLPGMRTIIRAFEKQHPDIRVEVQLTPWSSYWTTLKTAMRGGTAPDVFWMNAVNIQLYAANGVLEPLDGHSGTSVLDGHPDTLVRLYSYGGRHYGIPKDFDTVGLWYNKQLFDRAGVRYPDESWTWETARDAARELTDRHRGVFGMGCEMNRQSNFYPSIFAADGWVLKDDRSGFGDARTIEGLRFWTDMIDRGWAPSQAIMAEPNAAQNMFLSGKCAMNYDLSAMAGIYHADPAMKEQADVAVLPRGRRRATVIHGLANVMSAKSRHKEAAWTFLKFLGGERAARIQSAGGVTISSRHGTQRAWMDSMPGYRLRAFTDMQKYAVPYPRSKNTPVWENLEYEMLGGPFSRKGDVAGTARRLASAMDQALAEEARL